MTCLLALQNLIYQTRCKIRLKVYFEDCVTDWRGGFGLPVDGYIEVSGPEKISDIDWIELDPIVVTRIVRLVPPKIVDVTNEIVKMLDEGGIHYVLLEGLIRIYGKQLRLLT